MGFTEQDVLQYVEENDVKFIRLFFCDIFGVPKNVAVMAEALPRVFAQGAGFDVSAVDGFMNVAEGDLLLLPDPGTLSILPWRPSTGRVARMFCDIRRSDGTPFSGCGRTLLRTARAQAKEAGLSFRFGTECEFYLFEMDEKGNPTLHPRDKAGYLDIAPLDRCENVRREICLALEEMGLFPEGSHHEKGPGQNEIWCRPVDVLAAAESADSDAHSSPAPHPSPDAAQAADILPQYQELYAQNPDLAGWLCINGTNINYPVVQADNSYYLRRGFDRLYSTAGTLFLDERCHLATPNAAGTANALIYGHNTASGSMFSQLLNYADKTFYTAHPTFQFDTLYEEGTWQVAAVLRTELGADALPYYSFFDASTQEEWQQRVDAILELSLYDTGVVPQYGDQLLTLSTCGVATVTTNSRFAVLAVKIN